MNKLMIEVKFITCIIECYETLLAVLKFLMTNAFQKKMLKDDENFKGLRSYQGC